MRILETVWEKRNLGVNSVEFIFDGTESVKDITPDVYDNKLYDYQTCRIPVNHMEITYFLQEHGFRFAEAAFELAADLREDEQLSQVYRAFMSSFDYHRADPYEIDNIKSAMLDGIFLTDRIALDPKFSVRQSSIRYVNWFNDEIQAGTSTSYIVNMAGTPIGFFLLKNVSEAASDSLLGGLFNEDKYKGFGLPCAYFPVLQARNEGKKRITTRVSANNLNSVKVHLEVGYKIQKISYMLVKHI